MSGDGVDVAQNIAVNLRKKEKVIFEHNPKSLKSADKVGAKKILFIGDDELSRGEVWIKDLESKEEQSVKIQDVE